MLKGGDLSFDKDQNLVGFMRQSKTDHIRVGREFTISGREVGKFSIKKDLQWYKGMLQGVTDSSCVSPRGVVRKNLIVSYHEAQLQLIWAKE